MIKEIVQWVKKFTFNVLAAGLTALIIFFCIGIAFPKTMQTTEPAASVSNTGSSSKSADITDFLNLDQMTSARALNKSPSEAASAQDVVSVMSQTTVQGEAVQSAAPSETGDVLPLTVEEAGAGQDGDEETPPSLLEILSRSIFSYKTLLSREMPFIYGTEYIAEDIEKLMEDETAPEDLSEEIQLEINRIEQEEKKETVISGTGAQVLIYHTHTQEAYRQTKDSKYVAIGNCRTKDKTKSVVKVGDVLQKELEKSGFIVLHDKTNHEPPELNSSYSRSLKTMKKYAEKNKSLRVYIDLHRDASSDKDDVVIIDGKRCAKIMFVVGMGKSSSIKPDWKGSYKLANAITSKLEGIKKGFTRKVRVKEIRSYNQYMSDMCMLIEVGHNGNTLEEAENTMQYLVKAISEVIKLQ